MHKTCRVQVGIATPCLKTKSFITCPETLATITDYQVSEICGVPVAISTTGVMFTTNKDKELHASILSTNQTISKMHKDHPNKVQINSYLQTDSLSTQQFGLHMDHVTSTINKKLKTAIHQFHFSLCKSNRMQIQMHLQEAAKGNVNGLISRLIGDPSYR